ncbi:hypothetical protein [Microbacterium flavescens]|uniref:hypothetical protein n=1 Tax=Microbacterium flavescens TaxID=69366 RepID=UPI001BDE1E01|nr:hypothetical protein [Microbacterium flavescens]
MAADACRRDRMLRLGCHRPEKRVATQSRHRAATGLDNRSPHAVRRRNPHRRVAHLEPQRAALGVDGLRMRRIIGLGVAAGLIAGGLAIGGAAAQTTVATDEALLSQNGQAAIADLRTCLASEDTLNVYYLIDSSQSLDRLDGQASGTGSDPDNVRAPILANSLEELGRLSENATVNWAAGFFSTEFSAEIEWHEWQEGGPEELEAAIEEEVPSGYTNWSAALKGAQDELAGRSGCRLLVWLTDGVLDLPDGEGDTTLTAAERAELDGLCSADGAFNEFRSDGVVVIGALLSKTAPPTASSEMQRLVEGENAAGEVCQLHPMPDAYAHGAFVEADAPDSLRRVFLQLGAQVGGGFPRPFDEDGSFWIDPGVASFRIILSGDWTLHPPEGSEMEVATAAAPSGWMEYDGEWTIDVGTTTPETHGKWRLERGSDDAPALFLYSGLAIRFDDTTTIVVGADGEASVTLDGQVLTADGTPADLSGLDHTLTATIVTEDGAPTQPFISLENATVNSANGAISIPMPDLGEANTIGVEAKIDPLVTVDHGLKLAPVTTQKESVEIVEPGDYPRVTAVEKVQDLIGARGEAVFNITVEAPAEGGEVCFEDPTIDSDPAGRDAGSWNWDVLPSGCTPVSADGEQFTVTAGNTTAADTDVVATLPVRLFAAESEASPDVYPEQNQNVPLAFHSSHPLNQGAIWPLALLLLAAGVLLPLLGLWLVNRLTAGLDVDNSLQRGAFAVKVQPSGVSFVDAPTSDTALSERFRYVTATEKVRVLDDPDVGRISPVVPWFPLIPPWYRIQPSSGRSIAVARTASRSGGSGEVRADGSVRFAQLPFDGFWMLVVSDAELARTQAGDPVNGNVVIYHRASSDGPAQYRERLTLITSDTKLRDAVDRARARGAQGATAIPAATTPAKNPGKAQPAAPARESAPADAGPPPRPGSGASSPGSPPPRPSGSQSGSAAPPPPPPSRSSGPPPRPSDR